jgi:hypothetical protein
VANPTTGFPSIPQGALINPDGTPSPIWYQFFVSLWNRTGGAAGTPSLVLDNLSDVPGALLYRAASAWQGLAPAARYKILRMGPQFPGWELLDGNSFGAKAGSNFFVAPIAGGVPTFRPVATSDLAPIAGELPATATNDDATAGNLGEYAFSQIASGAAVPLVSGTIADITSIPLSPGDWDVWANVVSAPAPTTTASILRAWIHTISATDPGAPNSGAYLLNQSAMGAGLAQAYSLGMRRLSVPTGPNATAFLSIQMTFAVATMGAYGFLGARRAR